MTPRTSRPLLTLVLAASLTVSLGAALSGCAALLVGGAFVGGALVVTDRRSPGTQIDDQAIEIRAGSRARELLGDRGHVNTTSYNRMVLLTGEVATEGDKATVEQAVSRIENVRTVFNELAVTGISSLNSRSADALLTSKVKASLVDAKDILANVFKVVTERGTVYLMGRVTEREATRATEVAQRVPGVLKVVRVFDILTEAELAELPRVSR
ncbi:MAG: transporter [Methylibium sp. NZG]|nr:MAG: transporter [Methylibium sp. NZG]